MNRRCGWMACGTVIWLGWTAPGGASESLDGLLACRDLSDSAARLACFDRQAAALAPSAPAAGPAVPVTTAPKAVAAADAPTVSAAPTTANSTTAAPGYPMLDPQQQFGLPERTVVAQEVAAGTRASDLSEIEAHIVGFAPAADGRIMFTLDNDQVWRQLAAEGELLARQGDTVTISRGWFGSYWLKLKSGRGCKVTRLR